MHTFLCFVRPRNIVVPQRTFSLNQTERNQFYDKYSELRKELGIFATDTRIEKSCMQYGEGRHRHYWEESVPFHDIKANKHLNSITKRVKPGLYEVNNDYKGISIKPMVQYILKGVGGILEITSGYADAIIPNGSKVAIEGSYVIDSDLPKDTIKEYIKTPENYAPSYPYSIVTDHLKIEKIHLEESNIRKMYPQITECHLVLCGNKPFYHFAGPTRKKEQLIILGIDLKNPIELLQVCYSDMSSSDIDRDRTGICLEFYGGIQALVKSLDS